MSLMATLTLFVTTAASAAPTFKMPVPCGQTWLANNDNSSAHVGKELDFNRGSTAEADRGDTVVATAAGTVKTAKNQGTVNGYGNLVTIDHGGGWVSYYAHLETMAVVSGQAVLQGQPIGSVGNSSYRSITPHLHFEIRLGAGYPGNIQAVPGYNYTKGGSQSMKSTNCATQQDPAALCGSGYVVNDTARLGSVGAVVLTYNKAAKNNCAVTLKFGNLGSSRRPACTSRPRVRRKNPIPAATSNTPARSAPIRPRASSGAAPSVASRTTARPSTADAGCKARIGSPLIASVALLLAGSHRDSGRRERRRKGAALPAVNMEAVLKAAQWDPQKTGSAITPGSGPSVLLVEKALQAKGLLAATLRRRALRDVDGDGVHEVAEAARLHRARRQRPSR